MEGLSLRCDVLLQSVEEAQSHAEATSHANLSESTDAVLNLVCTDYGKSCRPQTERFYFGDSVLPSFESGIPLLKSMLQELPNSNNITIAFPDDDAWKRFYKQLQHFPMIICNKVGEGEQRIVCIKEGDPRGRHVVDDLVQSSGTLIECKSPEHGLSHFWITGSCPLTVNTVKCRRPFEVLSLARSIASALQI